MPLAPRQDLRYGSGAHKPPPRRDKQLVLQAVCGVLDRLRRAGYVHAVRPHGSPTTADPLYEIMDPYLAFWFAVLREDADLVEGGQGRAVQQRVR